MKTLPALNLRPVWSPSDNAGSSAGVSEAATEGADAPAAGAGDQSTDANGFPNISDVLGLATEQEAVVEEEKSEEGGEEELTAEEAEPADKTPAEESKADDPQPDLKATLKELLEEVKGAKPAEEPTPPEAAKPKYPNVQVPDTILQALDHEDPNVRRQGLNAMLGASMSKVYADITAEVEAKIEARLRQVPQMVEQSAQQRQALVASGEQFYKEYPQFNTPQARKLAAMVGLQLGQQEGANFKGMTPEFRKKLGTALIELTGLKTAPAAPATKGGRKQFTSAGPSSRGDTTPTLADEIMGVIN